jgi:lipopolysaccharide export system protein LptC
MTQSSEAVLLDQPPSRSRAFARARRHSRRVVVLRRAILVGSVAIVAAVLAIFWFDPFGRLPKELSVDGAHINGSHVTLEAPKLSGYREDGRPYDLRAASGVQDVRKPNIIELSQIVGRFETNDQATVNLTAPTGVFDSSRDFMKLLGDVRITSTKGFDVRMKSADMDFKAGTVVSNDPVTVVTGNGTIVSDRVDIADSGKRITFVGNVRSLFNAGPGEQPRGSE